MPENKLNSLFLLGTLKPKGEFSHTETLCELIAQKFKKLGVESEIIRLVEYHILPGVESNEGQGDEWPNILKKVLTADIIVFATPIWWGMQSSLIQRVIERMDALNDELLATGKSELANKIGGIVITGAEDGAQHIIGNLCNFMSWNGLTIPPACSVSHLGGYPDNKKELLEKWKDSATESMANTMTKYSAYFARLLKENPAPQFSEKVGEQITPQTVGMRSGK